MKSQSPKISDARSSKPPKNHAGAYYFACMLSLLIAYGFATIGATVGVIIAVIIAFIFCVVGKKSQWAYEDYIESIKQESTSTLSQTAPTSHTYPVEIEKSNTTIINPSTVQVSTTMPKQSKKITISFPMCQSDSKGVYWLKKYEYDYNIALFVPTSELEGLINSRVRFKLEPENAADSLAVAAYINDRKVGYTYKDFLQGMLQDWIKRDDMFGAYLKEIDTLNNKTIIKIAFYKSEYEVANKIFNLSKVTKNTEYGDSRYENILLCNVGDCIEIEDDYINDNSYIVYSDGLEIGELGSSFIKWIEENDCSTCAGYITEIDDSDGKVVVKVKILAA